MIYFLSNLSFVFVKVSIGNLTKWLRLLDLILTTFCYLLNKPFQLSITTLGQILNNRCNGLGFDNFFCYLLFKSENNVEDWV